MKNQSLVSEHKSIKWEDEENAEKEIEAKVYPKSDKIKESPLIKILKPLLDKITEDDLKIYQFEKNAKVKVQFQQYPEVKSALRQIFDRNNIFSTLPQLDAQCHYIGFLIMQYLFIVKKDIPLSRETQKFLKRESVRNFRGQLEKIKTDLKESCDFLNKKIIKKEEFEADLDDFIDIFSDKNQQEIAENFIIDLIDSGELRMSKDRLRQRMCRKNNIKLAK